MFCPLLPSIADSREAIAGLVEFALECGVEEVFVEPVNPRGPGFRLTQEALAAAGFQAEADAVGAIRHQQAWSHYVRNMVANIQEALRRAGALDKLRFLLYPSRLTAEDTQWIRSHGEGVRWLGNDEAADSDSAENSENNVQSIVLSQSRRFQSTCPARSGRMPPGPTGIKSSTSTRD